jgi:hypothetical protein
MTASSAIKAMNASRVPSSADAAENARSDSTSEVKAASYSSSSVSPEHEDRSSKLATAAATRYLLCVLFMR